MTQHDPGRRDFFRTVILSGTGLLIGVQATGCSNRVVSDAFEPNIWLSIKPDNSICVTIAKSEMGQGVHTSLAMLVADELDADWNRVQIIQAATASRYGSMDTAGSSSVRDMWLPLRQAGAMARSMLLQAAALQWRIDTGQCKTSNGRVKNLLSGQELQYGDLARAASRLPVPVDPPLKTPQDFTIIGQALPRLDNLDKVTGRARYGIDQQLPGLKYAAIRHAPVFGSRVAGYSQDQVMDLPGVLAVVNLGNAVAVVADSYWQAQQAINQLPVQYEGGDTAINDASIRQNCQALLDQAGSLGRELGEPSPVAVVHQVTTDYEAAFQAHATMEPMNCTVRFIGDKCEIWAPTQHPQAAQDQVRDKLLSVVDKLWDKAGNVLGQEQDSVIVHTTLLGGGFGRRLEQDFVLQAVEIARQTGLPIKLIWSRSEDIQHDFYRPFTLHRLQAQLDAQGNILSWQHRIAGSTHKSSTGGAHIPYACAHYRLEYHVKAHTVPTGLWRSVGSSHNVFVTESFVDQLAHQAAIDPYQYRRRLLQDNPRVLAVLDKAAELAGWGRAMAPGRGLGIAIHDAFGSVVCQVAEVSIVANQLTVEQIFCVVDCGMVVNPSIVSAQIEGGIAFGLTAATQSRITIDKGCVVQSNFHDFALLRMREMPAVSVHILPSHLPPGGIGEVGVPPVAPAVANALFAVTGKRLCAIPMQTL